MGCLEIVDVSKIYGQKAALTDFSMTVTGGEIVGLIGKNGAGKTTLLNCIAGNIHPMKGTVLYNGCNILEIGGPRVKFGISIEASFVDYLNTYENLALLMKAGGVYDKAYIKKTIPEVLKLVGLGDQMKKHVSSFSYGMKQRLGFAQALLNGTEILILDEPFAGLDVEGRSLVKDHIRKLAKENNIGVIFSDHNLDEVNDLCHRVVCIQNGVKVYDGAPDNETKYEVYADNLSEDLILSMRKFEGVTIDLDRKAVYFPGRLEIHEILKTMVEHSTILKVKSIENALEQILIGGGE